ncbi:hypothetical protein FHS56_001700 [Thermonema lapsum]|uniref:Uncharacterized protein n=1 Tax=Thermonema lapsum TaxID=28195 RepID=A0A846MSF3_9BACT|nr:hypothetical protein [Thermonema lapsum]NIK74187.1 hypothetical protein [Thermonema lapsum]
MGFAPIIIWSISVLFFIAMIGYYSLKKAQMEYQQADSRWKQQQAQTANRALAEVLEKARSIEQMQQAVKNFFDEQGGEAALDEEAKALILARKQQLLAERRYHYYLTHHPSKAIAKILGVKPA